MSHKSNKERVLHKSCTSNARARSAATLWSKRGFLGVSPKTIYHIDKSNIASLACCNRTKQVMVVHEILDQYDVITIELYRSHLVDKYICTVDKNLTKTSQKLVCMKRD